VKAICLPALNLIRPFFLAASGQSVFYPLLFEKNYHFRAIGEGFSAFRMKQGLYRFRHVIKLKKAYRFTLFIACDREGRTSASWRSIRGE